MKSRVLCKLGKSSNQLNYIPTLKFTLNYSSSICIYTINILEHLEIKKVNHPRSYASIFTTEVKHDMQWKITKSV